MDSSRSALIIASDDYTHPGLKRLRAPASDARALAAVLREPAIGGFEVRILLNEPAHEVNLAIEDFFADRRPDDLLLVHFSCHGVKDEAGELYFAASNTQLGRLGATAVAADFVNRQMSRSRSRRVVLLLDCCYAGAFERGMTARAGSGVGIQEQFGGRGRAVITASSAMEYAFEGDELADTGEVAPSVFTSALVEGLATGDADRDQDGFVALDELYDYVYDKVREATPNQTPGKWTFAVQGDLYIARRARPVATPAPLPPELQEAIDSPFAAVRGAAVQELARLLNGTHAGRALAAQLALERLTEDDSRAVAAAAAATLRPQMPPSAPPRLELSAAAVDFGRIPYDAGSPEHRIRLINAGEGSLNPQVASQPGWLKLRQEGDELILAVDTMAVGEHEQTVAVDSDGGSATIHVQALVEPARQSATEAATRPHEATAPGRVRPGARQDPGLSKASPAPTATATAPGSLPAPALPSPAGGTVAGPAAKPMLRAWIAIATAGVVVAAGAYLLFGREHTHDKTAIPPVLTLPRCTAATAASTPLPKVHTDFVKVGGRPFDVVVTPNHFGFVSLREGAPLVVMKTAKFVPTVVRKVTLANPEGEAFTHDRQYLLVAGGSGMTVFRVRDLEAGLTTSGRSLTSPGGKWALEVVPSPDDRFAFVALQASGNVAVFNLKKALTAGFGRADFVGMIPMRSDPTGIAVSADGRYLYVVSGLASKALLSGMGTLAIVDMRKAEVSPGSSVVKTVNAGCGPARVITSADGKNVWVTVGGGNALEAFSAAKLISDPKHALIARVAVGQIPLGLVLVNNGTRMVVADSNRDSVGNAPPDLAVIDVSKALAGRPAVLGTIKSGTTPRQFALEPNGKTLLVTNTGSGQVEAVNVGQLP